MISYNISVEIFCLAGELPGGNKYSQMGAQEEGNAQIYKISKQDVHGILDILWWNIKMFTSWYSVVKYQDVYLLIFCGEISRCLPLDILWWDIKMFTSWYSVMKYQDVHLLIFCGAISRCSPLDILWWNIKMFTSWYSVVKYQDVHLLIFCGEKYQDVYLLIFCGEISRCLPLDILWWPLVMCHLLSCHSVVTSCQPPSDLLSASVVTSCQPLRTIDKWTYLTHLLHGIPDILWWNITLRML